MVDQTASFPRHHMVWVDPACWQAMRRERTDLPSVRLLEIWAEVGWPLIARRPLCEDSADHVPLGLPLPPQHGRHRLNFRIPAEAILRCELPPLLSAAAPSAPVQWRAAIDAIVALDPGVRCFGSLAWQHLTGLAYVWATSDIDLLWSVGSAAEASHLAERIAALDATAPMRIDGEFLTPSGLAVQWREWQSGAPELVAKAMHDVRLIERESLFA